MKIICDSRKLTDAFLLAGAVAPQRSPKEILRNVKLVAENGTLTLTATDMEVGIRVVVDSGIDIVTEGVVLLPVAKTSAILRENTDESITIESNGNATQIAAARSKYKLQTETPDEFPSINATIGEKHLEIPARLLGAMIRRTAFATDSESSRYALGGINFETDGDSLIAVGTDGRRLAKFSGPVVLHGDCSISGGAAIVPTRAATLIERAIGAKPDDLIRVCCTLNEISVESPNCLIVSRLVEGRYPNWRQAMPKREAPSTVSVLAGPLHAAVRQAAIATDNESRGVLCTFSETSLRLEAKTADIGESSVELPVAGDFTDSGSITTQVNSQYVTDFLKVIDTEANITIEIESANTPVTMGTDDGYDYVIMPMAKN